MAYDSNNRSERLLQGRRFTTDNLTLSQEAFTDVFDLGAGEIYTDDGLIPTGSSQLPYSGSSQNGGIVSGSVVNPSIGTDVEVLKYHYRKKLKPAGDGTREVYYFTTSDPSSPTDAVTSDQLLESDQQTNFVSPKYIVSADSVNTTESTTPGYKVVVYKSTQSSGDNVTEDAANPSTYVFDFKTGVLTWVSGTPTTSQYVYISVYQYVGRTLRSQIDDGSIGGGGSTDLSSLNAFTGSIQTEVDTLTAATSSYLTEVPAGTVSGSSQVSFDGISDVPAGLISGSAQITITESQISDLSHTQIPDGTVSSSAQTVANLVGQDINVGTLTANEVVTNIVSQSISFATGSTIFGDELTDIHQITGSLNLTGSFTFVEIDGGNF